MTTERFSPVGRQRLRGQFARAAIALALLIIPAGASGAAAPLVTVTLQGGGPPQPGEPDGDATLTVARSGRSVLDFFDAKRGVRRFRLAPTTLARLRTTLGAARFASLQRAYDGGLADAWSVAITYAGRTVQLRQGAQGPKRLRPAVALLLGIMVRHGAG